MKKNNISKFIKIVIALVSIPALAALLIKLKKDNDLLDSFEREDDEEEDEDFDTIPFVDTTDRSYISI